MATDSDLPIFYNPVSNGKKAAWKLRPLDRRVHFIPLIVILCFIILWIFGSKMHQASISIEEDEDFNLEPIEINNPENMKETNVHVDLAMLGLATTPINVSDPESLFRANPEIEPSSVPVTGVTEMAPSSVPVIGVTDLNPESSASLSFGSRRLLIQEGNISTEDENFNDPVEIKKPMSIKEIHVHVESPFRASPEMEPSTGLVTRSTDLNPGSYASPSFASGRVLLQEGYVTYETGKDEKINELNEIKKLESIKETTHSDFAILSGNSSASQPLFQANPEISPLQSAGLGHQNSPEISTFFVRKENFSRRCKVPGKEHNR